MLPNPLSAQYTEKIEEKEYKENKVETGPEINIPIKKNKKIQAKKINKKMQIKTTKKKSAKK